MRTIRAGGMMVLTMAAAAGVAVLLGGCASSGLGKLGDGKIGNTGIDAKPLENMAAAGVEKFGGAKVQPYVAVAKGLLNIGTKDQPVIVDLHSLAGLQAQLDAWPGGGKIMFNMYSPSGVYLGVLTNSIVPFAVPNAIQGDAVVDHAIKPAETNRATLTPIPTNNLTQARAAAGTNLLDGENTGRVVP